MMISYFVISIVMLIIRSWTYIDIICFILNIIAFLLFQFTKVDKKLICIISIIYGLVATFLLPGIILAFGLILSIYSVILIKTLNN